MIDLTIPKCDRAKTNGHERAIATLEIIRKYPSVTLKEIGLANGLSGNRIWQLRNKGQRIENNRICLLRMLS